MNSDLDIVAPCDCDTPSTALHFTATKNSPNTATAQCRRCRKQFTFKQHWSDKENQP